MSVSVLPCRWSGLTAADFKDVTKTYKELRDDLFALISEKTILVGHGLSGDLKALKVSYVRDVKTEKRN